MKQIHGVKAFSLQASAKPVQKCIFLVHFQDFLFTQYRPFVMYMCVYKV